MTKIAIIFFCILAFPIIAQTVTNSVVVGGVTSNAANFWIRISDPADINIELSESSSFTVSLKGTPLNVNAESNFSGIIKISGLKADTKYFYRVLINDQPEENAERSFITFPMENPNSTFTFAFGSCQQSGNPVSVPIPGNVFYEIVKHQPRFFLHLGDWGYPDSTDFIPFNNNFFPAEYSRVHASYNNRFDLSYPMDTLLKTTPVDYVYDDHDFMNNNSSAGTSSFYVPFRPTILSDDFVLLEIENPVGARENIIKGYKENFPGYNFENESRGIYHKFVFGSAEFFVLDLRAQRSPNLNSITKNILTGLWEYNPPAGHSIISWDNAPGLGESQLSWFLRSLLNSTAEWKFIVSSVPFNKAQRAAIDIGLTLQDSVLNEPLLPTGTTGIFAAMEFADKWAGFQTDIDTILNFITNHQIKNVIVLSGDSHTSAIDDGMNAGLPEIMSGNLDITNSQMAALFAQLGLNLWNVGGQGITTPDFNDAFGKVSVYGPDSVSLMLIDEYGNEFASHTIYNDETVEVETGISQIKEVELFQNYPNPFNPNTTIKFALPKSSFVELVIYNVLGEEITVIVSGFMEAGYHLKEFNASGLPSGTYFYKITAGEFIETRKLVLAK